MKRFYMSEGKETPDGEYMLVADHESVLNQSVPVAWERKLQQFERLRQYAYIALAQAHQVIWEIDEQRPEREQADKARAALAQRIEGLPPIPRDIYDALVRDAMRWRSSGLANAKPGGSKS